MRKIKDLVNGREKAYVFLKDKAMQYRFLSDAERERFTFGDGVKPTERDPQCIIAVNANNTLWYIGWAGAMAFYHMTEQVYRVDYEKYFEGENDFEIIGKVKL